MHNHMQQPPPNHFNQGPPPNMSSMMSHHPPPQQQQQQHQSNPHDAYNSNQGSSMHPMWGGPASGNNGSNGNALTHNLTSQIEALNIQQNTLREQIHQSEANLTAQHTVNINSLNNQVL